MNQAEYEALSDNCLPPFAVTLYIRCFRKNMGYSNGLVHVSLRSMKAEMLHSPPRGSNAIEPKPTTEKIRTAVRQLERANLIELVEKGSIKEQKAACYYCSLASTHLSGPNEEQHESNTGTTRAAKSPQASPDKRYSGNVLKFQKSEEQHIPEEPIEEEEIACARENLEFCGDWVGLAKQAGWSANTEEIQALFNKWKFSDNANTYRHIATHRKYWMRYCAAINHNQVKGGNNHALIQTSGQSSGYRNATATAWRDCYDRAQRGEGVDDFDFTSDQT